jgi:hypothetical protein
MGKWRPGRSQARLPSEPDGHNGAGAQFHFLVLAGHHDAGAHAAHYDHGIPLAAVGSGDVDRPRADGVLLTPEEERVEVEGEASEPLDAARCNGRGDQAADLGACSEPMRIQRL